MAPQPSTCSYAYDVTIVHSKVVEAGGSRGTCSPNQLKVGAVSPFQSHAYQYCIVDYVGFSIWISWISMFLLNFNSDLYN